MANERVAYRGEKGWLLQAIPGSGVWLHPDSGWRFVRTERTSDRNRPGAPMETAWEGWHSSGRCVFVCQFLGSAVSTAQIILAITVADDGK